MYPCNALIKTKANHSIVFNTPTNIYYERNYNYLYIPFHYTETNSSDRCKFY